MASAAAASSHRQATQAGDAQQAQLPHVVIFPFMAKSHTIPLTHLAHLLRRRQLATVTFLTTPGNTAFVRAALSGADDGVAVVELPFTDSVECVEALDSLSSLPAFVEAVESALRPQFEQALATMRPPASVVVADAFLYWAHAAAAALGVRTLAFFGANMFAHVVREVCVRYNPAAVLTGGGGAPDAAFFTVPEFPHVRLALADIPVPFDDPTPTGAIREMDAKLGKAIADSQGLIVNTFDAAEGHYIEHWNRHRSQSEQPLCIGGERKAKISFPLSSIAFARHRGRRRNGRARAVGRSDAELEPEVELEQSAPPGHRHPPAPAATGARGCGEAAGAGRGGAWPRRGAWPRWASGSRLVRNAYAIEWCGGRWRRSWVGDEHEVPDAALGHHAGGERRSRAEDERGEQRRSRGRTGRAAGRGGALSLAPCSADLLALPRHARSAALARPAPAAPVRRPARPPGCSPSAWEVRRGGAHLAELASKAAQRWSDKGKQAG